MRTILVIDDNHAVHVALDVLFSLADLRVLSAESPEEGVQMLENESIDLVIQDMNFTADTTSGEEGIALFRTIRDRFPDLPIILLTAWTRLESAVSLVKAGAADYLGKPWDDHKLMTAVTNLLELGEANRALAERRADERRRRKELERDYDLRGVIFDDPASERLISLACNVARANVPVLISGPNGAGKERIAEIIQANSSVRTGPFVTLNCGALPSELIEAELFGADAGAYTGANKSREGKFEAADGGTLLLDEIGNLPPAGQMKLLRVLETGRFQRLGSNRERQVDVRVIAATNADLPAMIRAGTFREDLYYRLNVIELRVPPLSERRGDILPLAEHFLEGRRQLGEAARSALLRHAWPGNVREMKNAIQRALLLGQSERIEPDELGLPETAQMPRLHGDDEIGREAIEAAMRRAGGVLSQAAAELGLSRQALYRRLDKLGIPR
ncbi:sigma-54-dependent transcriptional regulator [Lysobacter sp. TAF61]|uniref:sigma-54-dependent transcriptional regulator n=1 Tax=Lysobacter sp. TAF61 TaxID=3233072 RepID=UPI003F9E0750